MSSLPSLPLLLLLLPAWAAGLLVSRGSVGGGNEPEVGADCGQMHHVIPKYTKAARVGAVAGRAQAAMSRANGAAAAAGKLVEQINAISAAIGDPGQLTNLTTEVEASATTATQKATLVETDLGTFTATMSGSEYSGADVTQDDIDKLQALTKDANDAADVVDAKVKRLEEKTSEAVKAAHEGAAEVANLAIAAVKSGEQAEDAAAKAKQLSQWAVADAQTLVTKATAASGNIDPKIADDTVQAPVWQALKDGFDSEIGNLTEAAAAVSSAEVDAAAGALATKLAAVKAIAATAGKGVREAAQVPADAKTQVNDLESATFAVDEAVGSLNAQVETVKFKHDRVQKSLEEVEKKLA